MRCTGFVISKLLDAVLLVELINTAAGVDQLLLAGVEGVALGADFNGDVLLGGAGLDDGTASTLDVVCSYLGWIPSFMVLSPRHVLP